MDDMTIKIEEIYVPAKRRAKVDREKIDRLAESIIDEGLKVPIQVRHDGKRYILVEGLHRLEACRALGEENITAIQVRAKQQ